VVVATSCGSPSTPQSPAGNSDVNDVLQADLYAVFAERGAVLDPGARSALRAFVDQGAGKLHDAPAHEVVRARTNLRAFAEAIADYAAEHEGDKGLLEVSERTFAVLKKKLCPVVPFC
jgi:hypothetical protein